jgi:ABC-type lipoprotein release transport system permease subunit
MTWLTYILRTVIYHIRDHALVLLGIAVAAAVITGSLVIGDSVRGSLHATALARIGQVDTAIIGNGRFIRDALAPRLAQTITDATGRKVTVAPLLLLRGLSSNGEQRANAIAICGVDQRFWQLAPTPTTMSLGVREVALNRALAQQLEAKIGDSILLRVEKPGFLPRDAPLSSTNDTTVAMRMTVKYLLDDAQFGRFSLAAAQIPTPTAFLDLTGLQEKTAMDRIANVVLVEGVEESAVSEALAREWIPDDALIDIRVLGERTEVRAERIFLDAPLVTALTSEAQSAGIVTYFVNELRHGDKATPYSLVAGGDWNRLPNSGAPLPQDLGADGIAINQWLADDLSAAIGDRISLRYFIIGPSGGLAEDQSTFIVRAIVPISGAAADRELMPRFPGISDEEDCKNWHPGVPIDLGKIRPVDEAYWDNHKGTPKAFISLEAGRRLFANRFGALTAVRLPLSPAQVTAKIKSSLSPNDLGLQAVGVRALALSASSKAMDFSGLFLGLGFFLVVAALTLAGMLVALGLARRRKEVGVLLALGFSQTRVGRVVLWECVAISLVGACVGGLLGIGYAATVLSALGGGWSAAVGDATVQLFVNPQTVMLGVVISALVAAGVLRWRVRLLHRENIATLLHGRGAESVANVTIRRWPWIMAVMCSAGAITITIMPSTPKAAVGLFFVAGALGLMAGIGWCLGFIDWRQRRGLGRLDIRSLAVVNATRGGGRSVAVVIVLAAACFLILAVGANRRDPLVGADRRDAGTGGFSLVMSSAVPMAENLNDSKDRERLGIGSLEATFFTPIRVGHGDDASCLNLNKSATPRLFGVKSTLLSKRFSFSATMKPGGWDLLDETVDGAIPAIGDENTTMWSLGLAVGDRLKYTDEVGQTFNIILVGTVAHSLLQGGLFISETHFTQRFPSQGGHSLWLIDTPAAHTEAVCKELDRALADYGVSTSTAIERLAAYLSVERTYLDIFLTLGGLALLIGSIGVGVVVARNVAERRGELAAAHAIGFTRRGLFGLIVIEHSLLLLVGLMLGAMTGALAVYPALTSSGSPVPWVDLIFALMIIVISGIIVIAASTRHALMSNVSDALRKE